MSYNPDTYTVNSNEALTVSIDDSRGTFSFHPKFTYPIFGDAEQIFGFKDLKISLKFDSVTFLPFLKIEYAEKIDGVEMETEVKDKLMEWLPECTVFQDETKWEEQVKKERETLNYIANGEFVSSYETNDQTFNIHKLKMSNDDLLQRLQIFVILFIEAGSYIDATDPLWDLFLITRAETREIIGFATTYTYFKFTSSEIFDNWDFTKGYQNRKKISQFVVFPPYQSHKHGAHLYNSLVEYWMKDNLVVEITVEDPNEKFDDLRYRCDFQRLYTNGFINELPLDISKYDIKWFREQAKRFKLEFQQFRKVVELGFVYNDKNIKIARLLIKKRLFEKNREGLLEFDKSVRNDKLQVAYENIKADYARIVHSLTLTNATFDDERVVKKQKI